MRIHFVLSWFFEQQPQGLHVRLEPLQIVVIHYCTKRRSRDSNRNFTRLRSPFILSPFWSCVDRSVIAISLRGGRIVLGFIFSSRRHKLLHRCIVGRGTHRPSSLQPSNPASRALKRRPLRSQSFARLSTRRASASNWGAFCKRTVRERI